MSLRLVIHVIQYSQGPHSRKPLPLPASEATVPFLGSSLGLDFFMLFLVDLDFQIMMLAADRVA